jgi:hypothetical protein
MAGVALAATLLVGCSGSSRTEGVHLTSDGDTEMATATGPWRLVRGGRTVAAGDRIRVVSGTAQVHLVPDGMLELRAGSQMQLSPTPSLQAGDMLIEPDTRALQVTSGQATASVSAGVARLHHGTDTTLAVYRGTAHLRDASQVDVKAPRQSSVPGGSAQPGAPLPLTYQPDDRWDQRYLASIETFGRQLSDAASGFDAQIRPGTPTTATFYEQLLPGLADQPDFKPAFDRVATAATTRAPSGSTARPHTAGGYLVASAIALRGQQGTAGQRLAEEVAFADQGADWGLVAFDQGVGDARLIGTDVLVAIGRAPLQFTLPAGLQIAAASRSSVVANTGPAADRMIGGSVSSAALSPTAAAASALLNMIASSPAPWSFSPTGSLPASMTVPGDPSGSLASLSSFGLAPSAGTGGGSSTVTGGVSPTGQSYGGTAGGTTSIPATGGSGTTGAFTGPTLPSQAPSGSGSGLLDPLVNPLLVGVSSLLSHLAGGLLPGLFPATPPASSGPAAGPTTSAGPSSTAGPTTTSSRGGPATPSASVTSTPAASASVPSSSTNPSTASSGAGLSTTSGSSPAGSGLGTGASRTGVAGSGVSGAAPTATSTTTTTPGGPTPPNTGQTN